MALTLAGLVGGLLTAFGLTRLIAGLLYKVSVNDPPTYVGVAAMLLLVAAVACYLPARRATRIDPIVALRHE
jgi:putative ABC transport system permease protein